jgi:hypothetical protein
MVGALTWIREAFRKPKPGIPQPACSLEQEGWNPGLNRPDSMLARRWAGGGDQDRAATLRKNQDWPIYFGLGSERLSCCRNEPDIEEFLTLAMNPERIDLAPVSLQNPGRLS